MKTHFLNVALMCFFALHGVIGAEAGGDEPACHKLTPNQVIDTAKTTIQSSDAALNILQILKNGIGSSDSLKEIETLIGGIKTYLMDGIDEYEKTPKPIFEWCDAVTPLLTTYKDQKATPEQRDLLIKTLAGGTPIMNGAQNGFFESSVAYNEAAGRLIILQNRLANNLDESNDKSVADFKEKIASIRNIFGHFTCTKDHIAKEVRDISNFKVQLSQAKTYLMMDDLPELRNAVVQSVDNVIAKCNEYHKKYE